MSRREGKSFWIFKKIGGPDDRKKDVNMRIGRVNMVNTPLGVTHNPWRG
jgi:hypothetical protein